MAPHSMETILQPPQWPVALSNFVTWCLMWDPKSRPTSSQAMNHEYFLDAVDPLRPKSSTSRLLNRKHSTYEPKLQKDPIESPTLSTRRSWFRKSLVERESGQGVPQQSSNTQTVSPYPSPVHSSTLPDSSIPSKPRPNASKRATWTNGTTPSVGAPMPILPSIRPISPLSATVTAQANSNLDGDPISVTPKNSKKIGRQLSVASNGSHYSDPHRMETERALNGYGGLTSPTNGQKESFFSHLRKRARRLSGRHQAPLSPKYDDIEANVGCAPWPSNRSSMIVDQTINADTPSKVGLMNLDKALQNVRYTVEAASSSAQTQNAQPYRQSPTVTSASPLKRHHSITRAPLPRPIDELPPLDIGPGSISSRTRRGLQSSIHPAHRYETPDEEEELLDEALNGVQRAVRGLDHNIKVDADRNRSALASKDMNRQTVQQSANTATIPNPYPTPSPSAKRSGMIFNNSLLDKPSTPVNINKSRPKEDITSLWPTPPYEENEWAASAAASIFAAGSIYQ